MQMSSAVRQNRKAPRDAGAASHTTLQMLPDWLGTSAELPCAFGCGKWHLGFILFVLSALLSSVKGVHGVVLWAEFGVGGKEALSPFPDFLLFKGNPLELGQASPPHPCTPNSHLLASLSVLISFGKGTGMIINYEN